MRNGSHLVWSLPNERMPKRCFTGSWVHPSGIHRFNMIEFNLTLAINRICNRTVQLVIVIQLTNHFFKLVRRSCVDLSAMDKCFHGESKSLSVFKTRIVPLGRASLGKWCVIAVMIRR